MIQFAPRRLTRVALLLVLLATSCSLRTSVTSTPTPVSQPPAATPDTSLADQQRFPDVLKVELTRKDDGRFDVAVTMSSPYDTPQRYADGWRVLMPDGRVLGTHTLAHDHASEQPFTRTQSGVVIPSEVLQVTVEGRDKTYGFGGKTVTATVPASSPSSQSAAPALLPPQSPPAGASEQFKTDFSKSSVSFDEILSGGPPKDGIPAIDAPAFVSVAEADGWLKPMEPVIRVQVGEDVRAYPIQILMWHEIVNDTVGGTPLTVTFCPLCNTAIAFERTVNGRVLDFGATGRLRYSNLIMYDRQTETWWQQGTGKAIVGEWVGQQLALHPATLISWAEFKSGNPNATVLSRERGFQRNYGANPYEGYDDVSKTPFLYQGPTTPDKLRPMTRVLAVEHDNDALAFSYAALQSVRVANATVGGEDIVVFWRAGTASALDASTVADGRDVGSAAAFSRKVNGTTLTFVLDGERIRDVETGSAWDAAGRAVAGRLAGKLAGQSLTPIVAVNHFWFSWVAFMPNTRVFQQ